MNHLKEFYKLVSSGQPQYTLATRYMFYFYMTFPGGRFKFDSSVFNLEKLGYLVQAINLPNLQLKANEYGATLIVNTDVGTFAYPGLNTRMIPDLDTNLIISFFDTEMPVFEVFFLPWLRSVADYQSMDNMSFPRANMYVELYDNKNEKTMIRYTIIGAYPVFVSTPDLSYANAKGVTSRDVRFSYNDVAVEYNNKFQDTRVGTNQGLTNVVNTNGIPNSMAGGKFEFNPSVGPTIENANKPKPTVPFTNDAKPEQSVQQPAKIEQPAKKNFNVVETTTITADGVGTVTTTVNGEVTGER